MAKTIVTKKFWQSKTIWAGVASLGIAIAAYFLGDANPIVSGLIALCSAFGIYGRFQATTPVKL